MKVRVVVASLFAIAVSAMAPSAQAELIVYDGFGYPDGEYLQIGDGGDNAGDPANDTGTYDNLDDGLAPIYDHDGDPLTPDQAITVLGDPGRNGGDGVWITSWNQRGRDEDGTLIDGTSTLSYTDSQGNSLVTTMGKPNHNGTGRFDHAWRTFDASGLAGGSLTFANTAGDYNVPRLGKQDSVVWMSFLGDRSVDEGGDLSGEWFEAMQFWNKQGKTAGGETADGVPFGNRTGGIFRDSAGDWKIWDAALGGDPAGPTGLGDIPGSGAADDDESNGDVFIVVKFDYSAFVNDPFEGLVEDGYANISVWVDPDLDEAEPSGAPAVTGGAYYAFNGINVISNPQLNQLSTSSVDEIRLGTTYADVSPIASAGQDGDFDGDGDVDGADFLAWQRGEATGGATPANLTLWQDNYGVGAVSAVGAVPEPSSVLLLGIAGMLGVLRRRR